MRLNAEDPERAFAPSPGTVTTWHVPGGPGVRLDSHMQAGGRIPPNYDSMIGKLLVHAPTREEAIQRMRRALDEMSVEGVKTTLDLHRKILRDAYFVEGKYSTKFLDVMLAT